MNHLRKFEEFDFNTAPTKEPIVKPAQPATRPGRPTPIRRSMPAVKPAPKAELKTATISDVLNRYQNETKNEDNEKNS